MNAGDVYTTVLSLYMHGDGKDLPLPTADEILLCTQETTAEQVSSQNSWSDYIVEVLGDLCLMT